MTPAERHASKVDQRGPDDCWPWTAGTSRKGYGHMSITTDGRSVTVLAHRMAWELANGPVPAGQLVCHRCDNPPCCNPAHLFMGSHADNQRDKATKARAARGQANGGGGKLDEDAVRAIRTRLANGDTLSAIAADHHVSRTLVRAIRDGKLWSHTT